MLLSAFRYNALKTSRRFVTETFLDTTDGQFTSPVWREADYIKHSGQWQVMEKCIAYNVDHQRSLPHGKFIAEGVDFKTAVSNLQEFEKHHKAAGHETEIDEFNEDFTHVDQAAKIIADQKFSLRQKIFGPSF
jgi:hypothetical protein